MPRLHITLLKRMPSLIYYFLRTFIFPIKTIQPKLIRSRKLNENEIRRCLKIVGEIQRVVEVADAEGDNDGWKSPCGHIVLEEIAKIDFSTVDEYFLNNLRLHSHIFSGYRLINLLGQTNFPNWNDAFVTHFPSNAPDWSIPAFDVYTKGISDTLICKPPIVMGEVGFDINGYCVNRDVIAYQERINLLNGQGCFEKLKKKDNPVILEIGCGYGALAYSIMNIVPNASYFLVDLPRSLIFSSCYLSVTQAEHEILVFDNEKVQPDAGSIVIVLNHMLEKLTDLQIDLAINTLSFAEMPADTVDEYARFIADHLAPDGALFEQNFDNSHIQEDNFCNATEILSKVFPKRTPVSGRALWGSANMWSLS